MKTKKVKRNKKRGGVIKRLELPPLPLLPGEEIELPERITTPPPEEVIKNLGYSLENYNKPNMGREGVVSPSFLEQSPVLKINEKFEHLYNPKGGKRNKTLKKSRKNKKRSIRYKK